ncbi:hypothetical protein XBO1_2390041 [Xenorhabdus bovienii str. oregonense]|uniref:Uncharacterized protein n=1 Tax=Xenorhabdus bovienii str. oregonense TaxID=1398202 RepID=A0A077P851_XENBV|nr:hypothetical protein XBO1_2390041 [Xenorhabdus bovienii str. oregonense]
MPKFTNLQSPFFYKLFPYKKSTYKTIANGNKRVSHLAIVKLNGDVFIKD